MEQTLRIGGIMDLDLDMRSSDKKLLIESCINFYAEKFKRVGNKNVIAIVVVWRSISFIPKLFSKLASIGEFFKNRNNNGIFIPPIFSNYSKHFYSISIMSLL